MSNVLFALWMALSVGLLLLFFYAAFLNLRNRHVRNVDLGELIPSFLPVNVDNLAGLIAAAQEPHSKEDPQEELRRVQLTLECLRRMTPTAALLQRLRYTQVHHTNPLICELVAGKIDPAVHLRP